MKNWELIKQEHFDPYRWNESTSIYTTSQQVNVQRGCNSITYTNLGDTIVKINGKTLFPSLTPLVSAGDSISLGGNLGEIYKGDINISFQAPVGVLPRLEIIQKFYISFE